ncbi:hypothetical protein [Kitasatospora griseola]|uniref:hypothetical protein n=1 Tax=Kitasatospora griseola TaxID=2064 RepID=UPI00366366F9
MRLVRRIAATGCPLALALGGVVAAAPTASASPVGCYYRVLEQVPDADHELVEDACKTGASGEEGAFKACYRILREDYVPAVIAAEACRDAAK